MKKIRLLLALVLLAPCMSHAQNLIQNPGAELFDASTLAISNWTTISGTWTAHDASGYVDSVKAGTYMFVESGADPVGALQQDVDVTSMATAIDAGHQKLLYTGWEQSFNQGPPTDQGITIMQCLNAAKSQVLYSWKSDSMTSTTVWTQFRKNFVVPVGTRYIRIQLISYRNAGSDNDGYFDALSLTQSTSTEGVETIVPDLCTLSPNPARQMLHIQLKKAGAYTIRIYAANGAVVRNQSLSQSGDIAIEDLPAGSYFMALTDAASHTTQYLRFVKQ